MDQKKKFDDIRRPLEQRGYQIVKLIGKGAFGEVMLVREKQSDRLSAVKTISKMHVKKKPFLQKYIDQQIEIMKKLDHPNIVKHESSFNTNDFIIIVMEYCDMGNLLTYQSKLPGKTFSVPHAVQIIVQVMKGLKLIHQKNFIHRDIKSQNVLLKKSPKINGGFDIEYKIADFGFAREIGGVGAKTHCGTEKYMAPEIINSAYYGISVDLWALGVLFFFMLFAEYPFKGHDMKADIYRRCNPTFNLQSVVSKKQKAKQAGSDVQDFFRKLFVIDPKKRLQFANIIHHPLFLEYSKQFEQSVIFYTQLQNNEKYRKDEDHGQIVELQNQMEPEDESRSYLLRKKAISNQSKPIQRQLQQISFQIKKTIYLRECATELFQSYSSYLTYAQRLAGKYYLLKAFLFYASPLIEYLQVKKMPDCLHDALIDSAAWQKCTMSEDYRGFLNKLIEEFSRAEILFQGTYTEIQDLIQHMPIKNFQKGYTQSVTQKNFEQLKFSYRSTTSHIFKSIHQNKKIELHLRNKIKMRLFCCHMINRIFNRKEISSNFPHFITWLKNKGINYSHSFDFLYFKKWILEENQENLQKNISLLHKKFF